MNFSIRFPLNHHVSSFFIVFASIKQLIEALIVTFTIGVDKNIDIASMLFFSIDVGIISKAHFLALFLYSSVILSIVGLVYNGLNRFVVIAMLIPQQTLLFVTCIGALTAVWNGHYADGYTPLGSHWFILSDQIDKILLAPIYTIALFTKTRNE